MVTKSKRHLLLRGERAGCGLRHPRFHTRVPEEVTCLACIKSVAMADLRVLIEQQRNQ